VQEKQLDDEEIPLKLLNQKATLMDGIKKIVLNRKKISYGFLDILVYYLGC
jgi:hypothetical protein